MSKIQVLGISGKFGVGKDYIYNNFLAPRGYKRWSFADHFKIWAVGRGLATYEEVFVTKPPHIREILQKTGTEEGRDIYGTNIWVNVALSWTEHINKTWGIDKFCITDCRFANEVEAIKNYGGNVIRIWAAERNAAAPYDEKARSHISETALDNYTDFDGYIFNDPKYAETVQEQIDQLLYRLVERHK